MKYLIWSIERNMWWRQNRHGYTSQMIDAGQFSEPEAIKICNEANVVAIGEMMVPVSSVQRILDRQQPTPGSGPDER